MLTFKFKQLGHGLTVKIGQVCEQTELMVSVRVQLLEWVSQQHFAQLPEWAEPNVVTSVKNGVQRISQVDGIGSREQGNDFKTGVLAISIEIEAREPVQRCN